ncbi:MAG: hypothetical protein IPN36_15290 [Bacteroidetes bacterium]|nr:hypothetical protein [Bacteroidota bacterium]
MPTMTVEPLSLQPCYRQSNQLCQHEFLQSLPIATGGGPYNYGYGIVVTVVSIRLQQSITANLPAGFFYICYSILNML